MEQWLETTRTWGAGSFMLQGGDFEKPWRARSLWLYASINGQTLTTFLWEPL